MIKVYQRLIKAEPVWLQFTLAQHHGCQAHQKPGARRSQPSAHLEKDSHQRAGRHLGFTHAEVRGPAQSRGDATATLPATHQHDPGDDADGQAGQAGRGHRDAQDTPAGSCSLCFSDSLRFAFHNNSKWFSSFLPLFCLLLSSLTLSEDFNKVAELTDCLHLAPLYQTVPAVLNLVLLH